jgi:hypothetical protein
VLFSNSLRHGLFPIHYTDSELVEELCQIAQDVMGYSDKENSWYYNIECVLGNMSSQVFPATSSEYLQWEAEYR